MKKLIWLDDCRDPNQNDWLVFSPIGRNCKVVWLRSLMEFTNYIDYFGLPDAISFDHDLDEFGTGYDAAKWLVDYCIDNECELPIFACHSANPTGKENILRLLTNCLNTFGKV